jgi:hypothetical protein
MAARIADGQPTGAFVEILSGGTAGRSAPHDKQAILGDGKATD